MTLKVIVNGILMDARTRGGLWEVRAALVSRFSINETIRRSKLLEMYTNKESYLGLCPGNADYLCCEYYDD
jgi:hypothetical protein